MSKKTLKQFRHRVFEYPYESEKRLNPYTGTTKRVFSFFVHGSQFGQKVLYLATVKNELLFYKHSQTDDINILEARVQPLQEVSAAFAHVNVPLFFELNIN